MIGSGRQTLELAWNGTAGDWPWVPPGLEIVPFRLTIDARQAVPHRSWVDARDAVLAAADERRGRLVLLLGEAGTGKTLLLDDLARLLAERGIEVVLLSRGDLVLESVELDAAENGPAKPWALLIDEARTMSDATLLRLGQSGAAVVVVAGLREAAVQSLNDAFVVRLMPLLAGATGDFVATRLAQAGLDADLVSDGAIDRLHDCSGGVARLLIILAGMALFLAGTEQSRRVEARHVDEAARIRSGMFETNSPAPRETAETAILASAAVPHGAPDRLQARVPAPCDLQLETSSAIPLVPRHRRKLQRFNRFIGVGFAAVMLGIIGAGGWFASHQLARTERGYRVAFTAPHESVVLVHPLPPAIGVPERPHRAVLLKPAQPAAVSQPPARPVSQPPARPVSQPPASAMTTTPLGSMPAVSPTSPKAELSNDDALPVDALPYVTIRYVAHADGAAEAARVALKLRNAGYVVAPPAALPGQDGAPSGVWYFFNQDQHAADAVAQVVGLPSQIIPRVPHAAPHAAPGDLPRPGGIELVLPPEPANARTDRQRSPGPIPRS